MKTILTLTAAASIAAFVRPASAQTLSLATAPPVVVKTAPVAGAAEVDSSLTELRVTFSKPMKDGSWSWCRLDDETFPEMTGEPRYLDGLRTCVLPVKLQPGRTYATWINVGQFQGFRDQSGQPAVPYLLTFTTAAKTAKTVGPAGPGPIPSVEDLPGSPQADEKTDSAVTAAKEWLALVDGKEYKKSWHEAAPFFKDRVKEGQWAELVASVRKPLGKLESRELISAVHKTSLPGAPDGEYVVIQFKTSFSGKRDSVETITPMKADGVWRVSGYFIK